MSPPNQASAPGGVRHRAARRLRRQEGTPPQAGRQAAERAVAGSASHAISAQIVDHSSGRPLGGVRYEVVGRGRGGDVVAQGTTAHDGIVLADVPEAGRYTVRIVAGADDGPADEESAGEDPAGADGTAD